jgi:GPI ethanolamine phosphate transferase 1
LSVFYLLGAFFPALYGAEFLTKNKSIVSLWAAGCVVLSTFTLLPVVKVESLTMITAGGLLMFGAGVFYLTFEQNITSKSRSGSVGSEPNVVSRTLMGLQTGVILLTVIVTRSSAASLQAKKGLPLGNQVVGWLVLLASIVLPFVHRIAPNKHYLHRLVIIFLTFSPSFVLLTISYEGLFYVAFCATLLAWVRLEHAIQLHTTATHSSPVANGVTITSKSQTSENLHQEQTFRTLSLPDTRRALFFLFFLQSGFFSTGNIASISSFSLDAVYRLIPIFDPFSQGALLLFKLMVPFAIICAALGILNRRLGLQSSALFMTVMSISDIMTLNFFWMVRDEGSWLDIGTTISHFVIGSLLCVFVAGLEGVSQALIQGVEVGEQSFEKRIEANGVLEVVKTSDKEGNSSIKAAGNGMVTKGREGVDERPIID